LALNAKKQAFQRFKLERYGNGRVEKQAVTLANIGFKRLLVLSLGK
jgi:hypothetical protein